MRLRVRSLASLSGLRIWCCHELWCRSKTWLLSCIAVAVGWQLLAPIRPLAWEPPYAVSAALEKTKKKKKMLISKTKFWTLSKCSECVNTTHCSTASQQRGSFLSPGPRILPLCPLCWFLFSNKLWSGPVGETQF